MIRAALAPAFSPALIPSLITVMVLALLLRAPGARAETDASGLGQLFTSPAQRAQIDARRAGKGARPAAAARVVRVDGFMRRSDGRSVVWVNGQSTLEDKRVQGVSVGGVNERDNQVRLRVKGRSLRLKPGQSWQLDAKPRPQSSR